MPDLVSSSRDPITGQPIRVTSLGATPSAPQQIIFGDSFHGSTLDEAARWTKTEGAGGTVVVGDGQLLLQTGTNVNGNAKVQSKKKFALYSGGEILMTCLMRHGTVPIADNDRYIGLEISGTNYFHWYVHDTAWKVLIGLGGGSTIERDISNPQANTSTIMKLQIRVTKSRVQFIANDNPVYEYTNVGTDVPLNYGSNAYALLQCINDGSTTNNTMYIQEFSIVRSFENWPAPVQAQRITASGLIARGPCWFLGYKKVSGTITTTIYDNTAASGTVIDEWQSGGAYAPPPGPIECENGIYASYASGTDPSIVYYAIA